MSSNRSNQALYKPLAARARASPCQYKPPDTRRTQGEHPLVLAALGFVVGQEPYGWRLILSGDPVFGSRRARAHSVPGQISTVKTYEARRARRPKHQLLSDAPRHCGSSSLIPRPQRPLAPLLLPLRGPKVPHPLRRTRRSFSPR